MCVEEVHEIRAPSGLYCAQLLRRVAGRQPVWARPIYPQGRLYLFQSAILQLHSSLLCSSNRELLLAFAALASIISAAHVHVWDNALPLGDWPT
jgi:hypothetical protein